MQGFHKKALELSEEFDTPFIIRLTTRIAHSQSLVEIGERVEMPLKQYNKDIGKYVMMPAMARKRHVIVEERMKRLASYAEETELNRIEWGGSTDIGVITSGICYQYSKEAFGDVSYLKLGMVYPLPEKLIAEFASKVKTLYVIEELDPFIEEFLKQKGISCIERKNFP